MHLLMWHKGGKHTHAHGHGGKQNAIDTTSDRLIFYDVAGSTVYDTLTDAWYKDGRPFTPRYPLALTLSDGRTVTASQNKGGHLTWAVK